MKTLALTATIACSLSVVPVSARAHDYEQKRGREYNQQIAFTWPDWLTWPSSHSLKEQIRQMNRMRGHVRWQLRTHRSNRQIRRGFVQVARAIDRINQQYKHGRYNSGQLRRQVQLAHTELHQIELALRLRKRDYYHWR